MEKMHMDTGRGYTAYCGRRTLNVTTSVEHVTCGHCLSVIRRRLMKAEANYRRSRNVR